MRKELTKDYVRSNKGCYSKEQVEELSFIKGKKDSFPLTTLMKSEIPIKDKFWWLRNKSGLTLRQKQDLAVISAEVVLAIYEAKYPHDKAPREAIQAAKDFLKGIITIDILRSKRDLAWKSRNDADADAAAAAYAAYAAAAAAAYAAAAAAADAAYAAADAYAAYAAAADAAYAARRAIQSKEKVSKVIDYTKLLLKAVLLFIKENN